MTPFSKPSAAAVAAWPGDGYSPQMAMSIAVNELPELLHAQVRSQFGWRLHVLALAARWLRLQLVARGAALLMRHYARDMRNTALWMESVVQHIDEQPRAAYIDERGQMTQQLMSMETRLQVVIDSLSAYRPRSSGLSQARSVLLQAASEFCSQVRQMRSAVMAHDADVDARQWSEVRRAGAHGDAQHDDLSALA